MRDEPVVARSWARLSDMCSASEEVHDAIHELNYATSRQPKSETSKNGYIEILRPRLCCSPSSRLLLSVPLTHFGRNEDKRSTHGPAIMIMMQPMAAIAHARVHLKGMRQ